MYLNDQLDKLKQILENEKNKVIEEILNKREAIRAKVLTRVGSILDLEAPKSFPFVEGDTIGYREKNSFIILGSVLYKEDNILTVHLIDPSVYLKEGKVLDILEAEDLYSYEIQLDLIERIKNDRVPRNIVELFFYSISLPKLDYRYKLINKKSLNENFELDEYQIQAIEAILSLNENELLLIIGPPGTGKTEVIKKAAYEMMRRGERVLITSHTNRAVDNAIEGMPVELTLRVGRPEKILPSVQPYLLGNKIKTEIKQKLDKINEEINKIKSKKKDLLNSLNKLHEMWKSLEDQKTLPYEMKIKNKRKIKQQREITKRKLKDINKKLNDLLKEKITLLHKTQNEIINQNKIVASTLIKTSLKPLENQKFDVAIIDESSQCSILLAMLGMMKAKKWVLIGDHKQLLPIFRTLKDEKEQEKLSAFVNLLNKLNEDRILWLKRHYRSNEEIIKLSSNLFYENKIEPADICKFYKITYPKEPKRLIEILDPNKPILFVNCKGVQEREGKSLYNKAEIEYCKRIFEAIKETGFPLNKLGIITPYRAQSKHLRTEINERDIEIDTVDAFQGREKDIIIFSITATDDFKFVTNSHRINVAITRAKLKLIFIGNLEAINARSDEILKKIIKYVSDKNGIYNL